ncbi:MAG: hypothetical protein IPH35_25850 [Rhodoferax sp.]|nr:hypothetical protein [Rhodoferax sp.]
MRLALLNSTPINLNGCDIVFIEGGKARIQFKCQPVLQGAAVNAEALLAVLRLQNAVNVEKYDFCLARDHVEVLRR